MPNQFPDAEARFRAIFEAAGMAICVADARGMMVECNPAMVGLLGYSMEEFRRLRFRDFTHPDELSVCEMHFADLMAGRRNSYQMEKRFLHRSGRVIWASLSVSAIPHTSGPPQYAIGLLADITQRKLTQDALQGSRENLEASVRASNTGLWDWNLKTAEVYYSPEWKSQLGYLDHEIGKQLEEWQTRVHPEDRHRAVAAVLGFLQRPRPNFEIEFRLRHRDGSYRWILSRASVQLDRDGQPYRMLGAHLDITRQKHTEERLREFEKVVEGLQEMIAVVDREYRCRIANRPYLVYRNLEKEQVIGQLLPDIVGWDTFTSLARPRLDQCFQGEVVKYELKHRHPKLGRRQLSISYLPIEGPGGIDRVACVLEDITDQRRAEQELEKAHEKLTVELAERTRAEQQVRALSERVITAQEEERRNIARELHDDISQQVATLSISNSTLARNIPETLPALRLLSEALHQRIARLAEAVRHLARRLHPALLEHLGIAAALQTYGAEFAAATGIRISVEFSGAFDSVPGPVGLCLYRVTQEALQNVAKYAKSASATVRIERRPESIVLVIQDSGVGFPDARASVDRGLGLVSMSERVRLVNGSFTIRSVPGEGTTVNVSIPC